MAGPYSPQAAHVDQALSDISFAAMNDDKTFVADQILPTYDADKISDTFYKFTTKHLIDEKTDRAPGTGHNFREFDWETDTFLIKHKDVAYKVPIETLRNADEALKEAFAGARFTAQGMMINKERECASLIQTSANYASGHMFSAHNDMSRQWSDYTNAVKGKSPIKQIHSAALTIQSKTLISPKDMILVLGVDCWKALAAHPDLVGRLSGAAAAGANIMQALTVLAELLNLKAVVIGLAGYESAAEGATSSMARIWTAGTATLVASPAPINRFMTAFGVQFRLKRGQVAGGVGLPEPTGGGEALVGTRRVWSDEDDSWRVIQKDGWQFKSTRTNAGFQWTTMAV